MTRMVPCSVAQVMVRWSMQHGFVPLPKSVRAERIAKNVDVLSFELTEVCAQPVDMTMLHDCDDAIASPLVLSHLPNPHDGRRLIPHLILPASNRPQADMAALDTLDERLFTEWDEWGQLDPTTVP